MAWSYGKSTLKSILENRENLKLYGERDIRAMYVCMYLHVYVQALQQLYMYTSVF